MPFDGLHSMPYRVQLELFKKSEWFSREPGDELDEKRRDAGEAFIVLCKLLTLFDGGKNWTRNADFDSQGNFCIRGGLTHIRKQRGRPNKAGVFINRAISEATYRQHITRFNDGCKRYSDVQAVLERARFLAAEGTL